jgi:hypothetical protein
MPETPEPIKTKKKLKNLNFKRRTSIYSLYRDLKRKPPILPLLAVRGSLKIKKILPDPKKNTD